MKKEIIGSQQGGIIDLVEMYRDKFEVSFKEEENLKTMRLHLLSQIRWIYYILNNIDVYCTIYN